VTGARAFQIATSGSEFNIDRRQDFLSLYPNRHQGILKPRGCKTWVTLSKHAPISDATFLDAVGLVDPGTWGARWGANTRFAVLDIDKNSQYHNELGLARLRHSLASIGFDAPKLYQSSDSQGWHLYLFFSDWVSSEILQKQLRQWLLAEGYTIKQGQLEVFPSNNGLRLPMQRGFAWLDDQGAVVCRREDKTTDEAIASFLDALDANAHSWQLVQSRMTSRLDEFTRAAKKSLVKSSEAPQKTEDADFADFFTQAGMIPEVFSFGQAYWQTGLTSPSQRHHAILCLGHYLWYGDELAGVRALPGVARADDRAAVIEAWLKDRHNGQSEAVLRGAWNEIGNDIRRACDWTAPAGSEQSQESYQLTDHAIDRLIDLTKKTGRLWSPADFKKGNIRREDTAREKIRAALVDLVDAGRRITLRGLARLSGCDHKTVSRHADIWGVFRLSNVGGDLSLLGGVPEPPSLLPPLDLDQGCFEDKDFESSYQPASVPVGSSAFGADVLLFVELPGKARCADFSMELDSLRLNLSGATASNSTATSPVTFWPSLPASLATGSSSGAGLACMVFKAGGILVCSLNGSLPSSAEPPPGSLHLPQTRIFSMGVSVRQSNRNCLEFGVGAVLKQQEERLHRLRARAP
jgi:hypothetical protein